MRIDRWMLWGMALLAACAPIVGGMRESPLTGFSSLPAPARPAATPTPGGVTMPATVEALVARAKADLAARLGLSEAEIRVVEAQAVTWPDSSLGCPEPGRMYLQVLTPGYRIVLEAGGRRYTYHAGREGPPFLCPPERARPPAAPEQ